MDLARLNCAMGASEITKGRETIYRFNIFPAIQIVGGGVRVQKSSGQSIVESSTLKSEVSSSLTDRRSSSSS